MIEQTATENFTSIIRTAGVRIVCSSLEKQFASTKVIESTDLSIAPGEFVSLLGPSGCGKSTLLRLIAGLETPTAGEITVSRGDRSERSPSKSFVFQDAHLLPWRNVIDNVSLPLELIGRPAPERREAAFEVLEQVGLTETIDWFPGQLSGGMKMRVSLARALVTSPALLLLDEPFAALDENTRFHLQEDLRDLWIKLGMTVVFVTHSIAEAVFLSDRALVFSPRPARLLLDHSFDLPQSRTAEMRMSANVAREMAILGSAFRDQREAQIAGEKQV